MTHKVTEWLQKASNIPSWVIVFVKIGDAVVIFVVLMLNLSRSTEVEMEVDHFSNGVSESSSNGFLNGSSTHGTEHEDCDADMGKKLSFDFQPSGQLDVLDSVISIR